MILNKQPRPSHHTLSLVFTGLSVFSVGILAVLTFSFPTSIITFNLQKQLIGSIFAAICLIGIIVGVFPSKCSHILHFRGRSENSDKTGQIDREKTTIEFRGHHPICGNFSAHIIRRGDKIYCAGCTGLVSGAIISLFASFSYSFSDFNVGESSVFVFCFGLVAVVCGLLQYHILNLNKGAVHFFLNVIFVLGAFFLLVGVHEITGNFILEFYLFTLIIYWIITRIMTSQLKHSTICATCDLKSCEDV